LFGTLATMLKWVILLPVLLAVVLLAVANDQSVTVHLNPFDKNDPVLRIDLALYQLAFILFASGALLGGLIVWIGQRKYRRQAHIRLTEAASWQARAERRPAQPEPSQAAAFLPRPERG
jgi:hypothetical protein